MIEIEAPDGSIAEFPDGTPDAVIESAMSEAFPVEDPVATPAESVPSLIAVPDEIAPLQQTQPDQPEQPDEVEQANLLPFNINTRTGERSFDPKAGVLGAIIDAMTLPGDVFTGKVDPNSDEAIGRSANLALVGSPAAAGRAAVQAAKSGASATPLKTVEQLRGAASAAYTKAEQSGLVISEGGYARAARNIVTAVKGSGFNAKIHPKVNAAIQEVATRLGKKQTLRETDELRRIIKAAAKSTEPDERRLASIMIDKLDDFVGNLTPRDVAAGDAKAGAVALTEARALWSNVRKSEVIEQLFEKATNNGTQFSGAGFENALRIQFRQLANNAKKLRGFTKAEKTAIQKVARGGTTENLARFIGKAAPTGIVSGALSGGAGFAAAGSVGAVALPLVGSAGRAVATRMTRKNAEIARSLARGGESAKSTSRALRRAGTAIGTIAAQPIGQFKALEGAIAPGS